MRLCADISLAQQFLGYNPQYTLTDGIKSMLKTDPEVQPDIDREEICSSPMRASLHWAVRPN